MEKRCQDADYMRLALREAYQSVPVDTAFCVGAVIVDLKSNTILSKGFSRELPGNTHAEECCLLKIKPEHKPCLQRATIYTTMEPCGKRLSGKPPCSKLLIDSEIKRVVVGTHEPGSFIANPEGEGNLKKAGVEVVYMEEFAGEIILLSNHISKLNVYMWPRGKHNVLLS